MKKIIFLDIDGVLNYNFWNENHQNEISDGLLAKEIFAWLHEHPEIKNWIVIDDLCLHNDEIEKHQIKTNQETGLTQGDVELAIDMLNNPGRNNV